MKLFKHAWMNWLSGFVAWTFLGLIFSSQAYVFYSVRGGDVRWIPTLTWVYAEWYTWALLSPLIFWLARTVRITRRRWIWTICFHLLASVVFCVAHAALQAAVNQLPIGFGHAPQPFTQLFKYLLLENYSTGLLTYWVSIGLSHFVDYYQRYREREALLAQAQLQALKMQLQPHFLFNSLNSISSLIPEEPAVAVRMVARLGDFLRLTLHNSGRDEITLHEEIEFLRAYLEIQMIRFADRLTVEIEVPADVSEARVPNLILQPLVENAIRHGISQLNDRGVIKIRAARTNGTLKLDIEDNGPGMSDFHTVSEASSGLGLMNTKARLANIYGENQHLVLTNLPDRGLRVSIDLPFRINSGALAP